MHGGQMIQRIQPDSTATGAGNCHRFPGGRLAAELAVCRRRVERKRDEAGQAIERTVRRHPEVAGDLQRLFAAADFAGIDRFVGRLEARDRRAPLAALAGAGVWSGPQATSGART